MRQKRIDQVSIFDLFSNHEIGRELKAISARLDQHREILDWIATDLHLNNVDDCGRHGLPAESVLRCALLKQYRQLSYQELAFHLSDSASSWQMQTHPSCEHDRCSHEEAPGPWRWDSMKASRGSGNANRVARSLHLEHSSQNSPR